MNCIEVKDLKVQFSLKGGIVSAVKGINFKVPKGKTIGLVGESGSGKSVTSLSIMQLVPSPPGEVSGEIQFNDHNLLEKSDAEMSDIRGDSVSMIFQEPMTSLNPVFTVGNQISEALIKHRGLSKKEALDQAVKLLRDVGIPDPEERVHSYPHTMSGGQRQRVMIAMAVACEPDLLIADEPTTALDVTIQKQILDLLAKVKDEYGMSVLFITHDLAVIADIADEVIVMYQGQIVEQGPCEEVFKNPKHPYTKGLMACRPSLGDNPERLPTVSDFMNEDGTERQFDVNSLAVAKEFRPYDDEKNPVILEVKNLYKRFPLKKGFFGQPKTWVNAVDGVSLKVRQGRTLGLVGESGCGKTTLGRTILRLIEPTNGEIIYKGQDLTQLNGRSLRSLRRKIQVIFQDPYSSLNPRMTIGNTILEPMIIHGFFGGDKSRQIKEVEELLERVGLGRDMYNRYPHEFSGGQRQRISIARALAAKPEFIVCDECVSALDVSIQAQILNLLQDLQEEFDLSYIFVSHDLAVVKYISDEVAVMNNGKIIEMADATTIYKNPQNEYTKRLLDSIPKGF